MGNGINFPIFLETIVLSCFGIGKEDAWMRILLASSFCRLYEDLTFVLCNYSKSGFYLSIDLRTSGIVDAL